ncbi:MAG: BON domain-containing protein [Dechloromonas sp.]|nr:MAG: BON domain-containing protein [Dechloromonas sp.]
MSANHIKVVTESGTVFLMGIVGDREAKVALQITRTTDGVRKVVNLFEVVSDAEIRRLSTLSTTNSTPSQPAPVESR